jgi:hypothetical protein
MKPLTSIERIQIVVSAMLIIPMFLLLFYGIFKTENAEPEPKFQVVDTYENCDVIRYTDSTQRWNYLLKCS